MSTGPSQPPFISFDDYLRLEAESEERHDYVDGQMIAMSGGSPEHSRIVANLIGEVRARLKGRPCEIFDPNLRIGTPGPGQNALPRRLDRLRPAGTRSVQCDRPHDS